MLVIGACCVGCFFFFQAEDGIRDVAVTGVQTCALPIYVAADRRGVRRGVQGHFRVLGADPDPHLPPEGAPGRNRAGDRKSTRLNSSHGYISYAVFCLKKKKTKNRSSSEGIDSLLSMKASC